MGSPIVASDFDIQTFSGDVCEQLKKLVAMSESLKTFFGWAFDADGNATSAFQVLFSNAFMPIGSIIWYPVDAVPSGCLKCDGRAIGRTDYAALFSIFGTTFGAGNGSTTFNLPDLRGKFLLGATATTATPTHSVGETGGTETHTLASNEMPEHFHYIANSNTNASGTPFLAENFSVAWNGGNMGNENYTLLGNALPGNQANIGRSSLAGNGQAHNNMPPFNVGIWVVKAI